MSWFELGLDLPPDPIAIAQRLARRESVVLARDAAVTYVACDPVERSESLDPEPGRFRAPQPYGELPRWFGMVPYEALRDWELVRDARPPALVKRPLWLRYRALVRIGARVDVLGEDERTARELVSALTEAPRPSEVALRLSEPIEPEAAHRARVHSALAEIARGTIYEVNLARRLCLRVTGHAWDLLAALERRGPQPHGFALGDGDLSIVAATPELCLRLEASGKLTTSPIKGTRPRSGDAETDRRLAEELEHDPKERAELTMIVDVERNDFGKVAEIGSVQLALSPRVVSLPSVHHRVATIEAQLRPDVDRAGLLRAVLPSGSVTGAPKRRAMELIADFEPHRRGLYTGVVGFIRHDGGLELKMAIRTLVCRGSVGHYFSGGGIVADSVPAREVEETLWKASELFHLTDS